MTHPYRYLLLPPVQAPMGSVMPSEAEASLLGLRRGEIPRLRKAPLGMTVLGGLSSLTPSWVRLLALLALAACAPGCANIPVVGPYLSNRGRDALDMFDIGVTITPKPQFGLYANCPFTVPVGGAKVDGYYAGIGGGKIGIVEHHQDSLGLIVTGHEKVTWGSADDEGGQSGGDLKIGLLGLNMDAEGNPVYRPQCTHYFHLGFVGVTGNINYKDIPDFFLGWFGLDICGDDQREAKMASRAERLRGLSARLAQPRSGLQLAIRTDKEVYRPDEAISLDVELVNVTGARRFRGDRPRDVTVYFEPVARNAQGESVEWLLKFFAYEVYTGRPCYTSPRLTVPAEARAGLYHHVTLPPGGFVGRRFTFAPAKEWLTPGDHFFVVTYQVSDDCAHVILSPALTAEHVKALGNDLAYTPVWTGRLYSNSAFFRVRPRGLLAMF